MRITLKNLQQHTFTVDFQPEKTVLQLKEQIFNDRGGEYIVERQKLIYAGVILEDERTIASYNVDEKKFVVVMLKREVGSGTKQAPAEQTASPNSTTTKTNKETELTGTDAAARESKQECEANTQESVNSAGCNTTSVENAEAGHGTASLQSSAESSLLMGDEYNRTVDSMIEMGYCREMAERAMAASFNNPERAVEYLISGIPENEEGLSGMEGAPLEDRANPNAPPVIAADPFEFLRNQPQFLQMRSLVHQNPDLLHAVLQQIGQTNPALLQLIQENQDAFLNMLNQPIDGSSSRNTESQGAQSVSASLAGLLGDTAGAENISRSSRTEGDGNISSDQNAAAAAAAVAALNAAASEHLRDNTASADTVTGAEPIAIRLTVQDQDAIERLKALGFPEALVLQAYFACEKNEQLAANFLLSSAFDD